MFNRNSKEDAFLTVDDVVVGLDNCGKPVFFFSMLIWGSFDQSCLGWISPCCLAAKFRSVISLELALSLLFKFVAVLFASFSATRYPDDDD